MKVPAAALIALLSLSPLPLPARARTEFHPGNPADWSGHDVYQILNRSPWTATVKVNLSSSNLGALTDSGVPNNAPPPPPTAGGMGRRGSRSATYSSGGGTPASGPVKTGPTEVKIQWQSAPVVQLAAARKDGGTVDQSTIKPLDEYIIAIIGLPITALGGRSASADSDSTINSDQEGRIERNVKTSASLIRPNHDALAPTKVELDQGSDGRMLIHFPKKDAITEADKTVEFRLAIGRSEIKKKFVLKDMDFEGKLNL